MTSCPRVPPCPQSPAPLFLALPGALRSLPHKPLGGGLLRSFCSILRAPAPPSPPIPAPARCRAPCLAVPLKGLALLATTEPSSMGHGHRCSEEADDEDNRGRSRRSVTPAPGPSQQGRAEGGSGVVLKKGPRGGSLVPLVPRAWEHCSVGTDHPLRTLPSREDCGRKDGTETQVQTESCPQPSPMGRPLIPE